MSPVPESRAQWPRMLHRSRPAVFIVALAVVVGACGGTGGAGKVGGDPLPGEDGLAATCWSVPQTGSASPGGPANPRAATVAGIARLEESTGTARFATSTCLTLPEGRGDNQLWVSDGLADFDGKLFRFRMKGFDAADHTRSCFYEHVVIGDRYWGRGRACAKPHPGAERWEGPGTLTTDEPRLFTPSIPRIINGRYEYKADPYKPSVAVRRQIVDALIARFESAGTEELHGEPMWGYRLTLDKDRARTVLPANVSAELAWGRYESPTYRTLDVWLDAEGHLRRLVAETRVFGTPARIGYELWGLGTAPAVSAPDGLPGR